MRVVCTLPEASDNINGVAFTQHSNGMISEEISDEQAAWFLSIPGYESPDAAATKRGRARTEPAE